MQANIENVNILITCKDKNILLYKKLYNETIEHKI